MEDREGPLNLAAISLGASLGEPLAICRLAVAALDAIPLAARVSASRLYRTAPFGGVARQPFVNGVILLHTSLDPEALRALLADLERRLGRKPARRWADRVLDLDLLLYGAQRIQTPRLVLPHPRLADRPEILAMLYEAWPDAPNPWTGLPWRAGLPVSAPRAPVGVLPRRRLARPAHAA